jgi:hypothetical protein
MTIGTATKTIPVMIDLNGFDEPIEVDVEVIAHFTYESYGEDADGNRGVFQWELDTYTINKVKGLPEGLKDWYESFAAHDAIAEEISDIIYDVDFDNIECEGGPDYEEDDF